MASNVQRRNVVLPASIRTPPASHLREPRLHEQESLLVLGCELPQISVELPPARGVIIEGGNLELPHVDVVLRGAPNVSLPIREIPETPEIFAWIGWE